VGTSIAISSAMTAITTNSSISVKAFVLRMAKPPALEQVFLKRIFPVCKARDAAQISVGIIARPIGRCKPNALSFRAQFCPFLRTIIPFYWWLVPHTAGDASNQIAAKNQAAHFRLANAAQGQRLV
jgi:hypothetical protein